jgi:hypothetical protein
VIAPLRGERAIVRSPPADVTTTMTTWSKSERSQ